MESLFLGLHVHMLQLPRWNSNAPTMFAFWCFNVVAVPLPPQLEKLLLVS